MNFALPGGLGALSVWSALRARRPRSQGVQNSQRLEAVATLCPSKHLAEPIKQLQDEVR